MKILYYEMRKSWLRIPTFIVLAVFLALNIFRLNDYCRDYYSTYGGFKEPYFRLYNTVCGELTNENLVLFKMRAKELENEIVTQTYSTNYDIEKYEYTGYAHGDFSLYSLIITPEISYCATYSNTSNKISEKAAESYHLFNKIGNTFEAQKNKLIYKQYANRHITEYRATNWANAYFSYDFSSLLCVVLLVFGLAAGFTKERESGMSQLITAYGKSKCTVFAKIGSALLFCLLLSVAFTVSDFVSVQAFLGVDGVDMPIYSAKLFELSPYKFSFAEGILLCGALRLLGLFAISLMISFISKVSPNTVAATVASFGMFVVLILLSLITNSVFDAVNLLTPKTYLLKFNVVNLLGFPVLELYAAVVAVSLLCAVLILLIAAGRTKNASSRD